MWIWWDGQLCKRFLWVLAKIMQWQNSWHFECTSPSISLNLLPPPPPFPSTSVKHQPELCELMCSFAFIFEEDLPWQPSIAVQMCGCVGRKCCYYTSVLPSIVATVSHKIYEVSQTIATIKGITRKHFKRIWWELNWNSFTWTPLFSPLFFVWYGCYV